MLLILLPQPSAVAGGANAYAAGLGGCGCRLSRFLS